MRMLSASLTATSALIALVASGFVPAPASVSLFGSPAEARQPGKGPTKGKSKKPRVRGKAKAPAGKQAANAQKKAERKRGKKQAKSGTTKRDRKGGAPAGSGVADKAGSRLAGRYTTMAGVATVGANMGLSAGSVAAASRDTPPLPPTPAPSPGAKARPAAAKQAANSRKKATRADGGKTARSKTGRVAGKPAGPSRKRTRRGKNRNATVDAISGVPASTAAAPAPNSPTRTAQSPRKKRKATGSPAKQAASKARKEDRIASEASSMVTRAFLPIGGGAPIAAPAQQQSKSGKKSRFYWVPFRNWFGGGKKK